MSFSRAERAVVTDWWITVDRTLLALILVLAVAGLAASFAASPYIAQKLKLEPFYFVKRHTIGVIAALAIMFIVSLATPQQVKRLALIMFGVGLALMVAALLQGMERNGAVRWLNLGGVLLQPSEFVKPGFVVLSAWNYSQALAVVAASTMILTAGYILWAIQRVYLGAEYKGPHGEALTPLTRREFAIAAPLLVLAVVLGVYPQAVLSYTAPSVERTVESLAVAQS
jgi:cell division protein FtsW